MTIWQTIKKYPTALVWALVIHVVAFVAIGISFKSSDPKISAVKQEKIIEAVAVDEKKIKAEINKLKKADAKKIRDQKRLQDKARKAKKARENEEKKLRALKKKQLKQQQLNKKKQAAEKKRLAELEKSRKAQEQQEKIRLKKLSELEKKEQDKKAQLEREEKQRKDKVAKKKQQEQEQKRIKREQQQIAKYKSLIKSYVTNKWILPASYRKGMKCVVLVRLIPSGDVAGVRFVVRSGNAAFDNSVEMAINKASPLPLPKSSEGLYENFREVEIVFDPNE